MPLISLLSLQSVLSEVTPLSQCYKENKQEMASENSPNPSDAESMMYEGTEAKVIIPYALDSETKAHFTVTMFGMVKNTSHLTVKCILVLL